MEQQISQWIIIGIVVAFVAFDKAKIWFVGKKSNTEKRQRAQKAGFVFNPHPPGDSPMCRENRDKIISLETKVDNLTEDVRDIRRKMNGKG